MVNRSYLLLALSEGQVLEFSSSATVSISQFHQFRRWIGTRAQDENNGHCWCALFEDQFETYMRGSDEFFPHDLAYVIDDASINAIDTETSYQHQFFKRFQLGRIIQRKVLGFRSIAVVPLKDRTLLSS